MASPQRTSPNLASMLPGPRFGAAEPPAAAGGTPQRGPAAALPPPLRIEDQSGLDSRAAARQERRRMKQASPLEGRNVRQSGTGESDGGLASPTRSQPQQQGPQGTPPPLRTASPEVNPDMARYGLAVEAAPPPSPTARPLRQRLPSAGRQSPEPRPGFTPPASDQGSDLGSPSRRMSRTDLHSSRDSLDSASGIFRSNRRGSGFKKSAKPAAAKAAPKMGVAELHVVGEIVGASGFNFPMLFCRWELVYDTAKSWKVVQGLTKGATHACRCELPSEEDLVVWEHPLDFHMRTQSLQGWPSLLLRVHARDEANNRDAFVSYALVKLPTTPGLHHISCHTWFAVESNRAAGRTFFGWFTGLTPRLEDESFITDLRQREDAGPLLCTVGAGEVHLRLSVLTKNFSNITHQGGESLAAALERLNTNIHKSAAMEERRRSSDSLTEGQRLVRGGREERIASARVALDSRRRGDQPSPAPSDTSRNPSFLDRQSRSSFRGFGGPRTSASPGRAGSDQAGAGQDDGRSETSLSGYPRTGRGRYAERMARRERERAAAQTPREGGSAAPSVLGPEGSGGAAPPSTDSGGGGAAAPPSRPLSASRTNSGPLEPSASRNARMGAGAGGGGGGRPVDEDDGLETIAADDDSQVAARAAAREARRAQQRSAF